MKKITAVLLLVLAASCTTIRLTTSWKDPETAPTDYKQLVIFSMMQGFKNPELQVSMERHMAEDLKKMGYRAVAATDIYGPRSFKGKTEDEIIQQLRKDGYDAVISLAVLDILKEENYVQGRVEYWPGGIYRSRFGRYYYYWYDRVYQPGYYVTSTKYILEANLFDALQDKLIFSAQTESIDPLTLDKLGHRFSIKILTAMKEKGALK